MHRQLQSTASRTVLPAGRVPLQCARFPPRQCRCRWADDSKEQADSSDSSSTSASTRDPVSSRRLINQLLQIQSLQSVDLSAAEDGAHEHPAPVQELHSSTPESPGPMQATAASPEPTASVTSDSSSTSNTDALPSLFEDPAAADYDPLVLDMLGFTSVAQYLDAQLSSAAGEAKVSLVGVTTWASLGAACLVPLGGPSAYSDSLAILTDGGLDMTNLSFLWVALLTYYSIKGCAMSLVTGVMSWRLHEEQGDRLEEIAANVQAQEQRRAFWQLQGRLQAAHDKANRTYAEFALSSLLLGVLLLMDGGPDHLLLQLETLDQEAFLKLLVILWLFWEAYFSTVGGVLKVSQLVTAAINKWSYSRKWGRQTKPHDTRQ